MNFKLLLLLISAMLFTQNTFAGVFLLNQNQYLEISFTISDTNGVFDSDIDRLSILPTFGDEFLNSSDANQSYTFFDSNTPLGTSTSPGIISMEMDSINGVDFTSIRNGSIQGTIKFQAWFDGLPNKFVEVEDSFGYSLDICDTSGCRFADNSFVTFGGAQLVSSQTIPEPSIILTFILAFIVMLRRFAL